MIRSQCYEYQYIYKPTAFSHVTLALNTILTLTIRSQVCAASSGISLRANKDLFENLSQTLAAQPTLYHLYIREERLHLALDIETLRALTVKFARYQPLRGFPESNGRSRISSRNASQDTVPSRFPTDGCGKRSNLFSERTEARKSAAPRTELLFWYRLTTTDWLNW